MKKQILLSSCFLFGLVVAQAENPVVRVDSICIPGDSKMLYTYNNLNQISECLIVCWNGENSYWEESDRNERTYDENGRQIEQKAYEYIDGVWHFARTTKLFYDEAGRLETDTLYTKYGEATGVEEFSYNEKGQMIQSIYYDIYEDEGKVAKRADSRIDFFYDESGNIIKEIEYDLEEEEPEVWYTYTYTYDNETPTIDGTKKIVNCICTYAGVDIEVFYYYSVVSTTGTVNLPQESVLREDAYNLSGSRLERLGKGQYVVRNNKVCFIK